MGSGIETIPIQHTFPWVPVSNRWFRPILLLQQEVGAHENRQGFIVSNVALLFEEQDVEILRYRECRRFLRRHPFVRIGCVYLMLCLAA